MLGVLGSGKNSKYGWVRIDSESIHDKLSHSEIQPFLWQKIKLEQKGQSKSLKETVNQWILEKSVNIFWLKSSSIHTKHSTVSEIFREV